MDAIWIIFLFAIGACVGSFMNVVIYRVPRGESIVFPGSHCPSCGKLIKWYDNIPLISWLALGAKCRFCKCGISPRYILIELATAVMVAGLYICYYVLRVRDDAGDFMDTWPTFTAHACLLCGLLVCAAVDIELWIVPLEVCWLVSIVGVAVSTISPNHDWMPPVAAPTGAMCLAAGVGLIISLILQKYGILQQSFLDADDKPVNSPTKREADTDAQPQKKSGKQKAAPPQVAMSASHGVSPRIEVLREVLFLMPATVLAIAAYYLVTKSPAVASAWNNIAASESGSFGLHVNGFLTALCGYLIGGLWIWGTRIFGTLAFNKEAMGLGDVHIMAAVGATVGWLVPSVAFFVAPLFGLLWALYLLVRRNQRELPYGPWLAAGTLVVMLFYDRVNEFVSVYKQLMMP
ncbi:MAG: prepilin peptidase [Planctomycetaceae bacterium]|nr:MAG: prepilin peptidase [Planctomycetaceae bacterium]